MERETTFTKQNERVVVKHDEEGRVISAQRFRDDELIATTTDIAVIKGWMANPN